MLRLNLETCVLGVLVFMLSCSCFAEDSDLASLRKVLLQTDSGDQYGLSVPSNDARLQAIEQLGKARSAEAVHILQEFLTSHGMNRKLKQHALVTLGQIGTEPAIDAIRQFEKWSQKRFMEPPPFYFGKKDYAIDHFSPHEIRALAETTDDNNKGWALFTWSRFGTQDLWLTSSLAEGSWSQPILLSLTDIPEISKDTKCKLQIKGNSLKVIFENRTIESEISSNLVDSDKDGLVDSIEARILTDVKDPDSDKDDIPDGKDSNPLTPRHKDTDDVVEIRQVVFSVLFATSNSQDAIVVVDKGDFAKQEYYGYGGVVLHSQQIRHGFVNITGTEVKISSPTAATATISDWEGGLAASGHEAKLRKIKGKWVVVQFRMTWIS